MTEDYSSLMGERKGAGLPAPEDPGERAMWREFVATALRKAERRGLDNRPKIVSNGGELLSGHQVPLERSPAFLLGTKQLQEPIYRASVIRRLADSKHVRNLALNARRDPAELPPLEIQGDGSELAELLEQLPRYSAPLASLDTAARSRAPGKGGKAAAAVPSQQTSYPSGDSPDNAESVVHPLDAEALTLARAARSRRRKRYKLREVAARASHESRVAKCGNVNLEDRVSISRGMDGRAHYSGLLSCGLVWLCPVCSAKISRARGEQITLLLERHHAVRGGSLFGTLTLRHHAGERLRDQRQFIGSAFTKLLAHRDIRAAFESLGIVGHVRASETTHGDNGWHSHIHYALLSQGQLSRDEAAGLELLIAMHWIRIAIKAGRAAPLVERQTLEICRAPQDAAKYLAKWGVAQEMTGWVEKSGRHGGRSPWEILADYGRDGSRRDKRLWREWEKAMKWQRQLTWSKGLKARYGIPESSDQAEAYREAPSRPKLAMNKQLWNTMRAFTLTRERVLEAVESGNVDLAIGILCHLPAYLDGARILSVTDTAVWRALANVSPAGYSGDDSAGCSGARATWRGSPLLAGAIFSADADDG